MSFRASDRRHWRGNPFPAPAGAESPPPSAGEVARSAAWRDVDPPYPRCSSVGGDAHAVERSGTSTLGVHRPAVFASYSGRTEPSAPTHVLMCRVSVPCLSLWERWPSAARTERVNNDHLVLLFKKAARPSQSPAVTALPKGEPRICAPLYRRIPRRREAVRPCNRLPTEWPSYFPKMQIIFYCGEKKPLIS